MVDCKNVSEASPKGYLEMRRWLEGRALPDSELTTGAFSFDSSLFKADYEEKEDDVQIYFSNHKAGSKDESIFPLPEEKAYLMLKSHIDSALAEVVWNFLVLCKNLANSRKEPHCTQISFKTEDRVLSLYVC